MARPDPENLERQIHQALTSLPSRRAPRSLENRILSAIAERQARPWWHQSYAYWPMPVRVAFFVLSAALAAVLVYFAAAFIRPVGAVAGQPVETTISTFQQLRAAGSEVAQVLARLVPSVSSTWLYAGLAAFASGYALLIGAGAAAYRVLWRNR